MIDLHMHTKHSDGTDNVIELLKKAEEKKLNYISITDHNTVDAYDVLENINVSDYYSGKIIVGVELNTKVLNIPIEILGYNFDYKLLKEKLPYIYISAEERNKIEFSRLIEKCKKVGIEISDNDIANYDGKSFTSKYIHQIITQDINNKKFFDEDTFNSSINFYRKYMSNPACPFYVEMDDIVPDFETASNLIKECGGKVFLPHMFEYKDNSNKILEFILDNYTIDGIECFYTTFSKEQSDFLLNICNEKKLLISGGSDYHGTFKPNVDLGTGFGNLLVPESILNDWHN